MNDYKNYNLYIYALTDFYIHLIVSSCLFRQLQLLSKNIKTIYLKYYFHLRK